jgi:hypothetical protein
MLTRDITNDMPSCLNMFVCFLYIIGVFMGVAAIFVALYLLHVSVTTK